MRKFTISMLVLACLWPVMASAQDCHLKIVNTVPIELSENGSRVFVPVIINGTKETFLLDTGGNMTQISVPAARDLNLTIGESSFRMLDLYGQAAAGLARINTLQLGHLQDHNTDLPVMTSTFENQQYVGLLAPDYMGNYDIELDFTGGKMNYFSQAHCPGKVVYWPAAAIAAVPMRFVDRHLRLDVMMDGHPVRAIIDTGAPHTTLNASAARQIFGITADSPGAKELGEYDGGKVFEYVFKSLSFEGMMIGNPRIEVFPDKVGSKDPNNSYVTGTRLHRVDDPDSSDPAMLIGMDILSKLHLYIAFSENKIYITPASAPARPQAAPNTPAAAQ